jgi:hypothetical protein
MSTAVSVSAPAGQLGLGAEADECVPTRLTGLCRGATSREALLATAAAGAAAAAGGCTYVAPADRFAVVPEGDGDAEVPGASVLLDDEGAVPGAGACGHINGGVGGHAAAAGGGGPAAKKARLAAAAAAESADDAAVPGSS